MCLNTGTMRDPLIVHRRTATNASIMHHRQAAPTIRGLETSDMGGTDHSCKGEHPGCLVRECTAWLMFRTGKQHGLLKRYTMFVEQKTTP